jgi:outer membrane protein OmpA-like peptidoglycan-associated protein
LEDGTNNLSKRRAAAVRQLLVDQYHVAAERLNVLNFPASTIISGMRAENRRVEFVVAR